MQECVIVTWHATSTQILKEGLPSASVNRPITFREFRTIRKGPLLYISKSVLLFLVLNLVEEKLMTYENIYFIKKTFFLAKI